MDTVEPGRGIVPVLTQGRFESAGETILGADDKSAMAILLEVLTVLQERNLPHGPLELVFTVCEEVGLLGSRNFDMGQLKARYGYALDATDPNGLITRAPAADHFTIIVHGRQAHAGSAPEKGVNAIVLAGKAIAELPNGRIDRETTCNIGRIEGGLATNIVAPKATVFGEIRSHDEGKLAAIAEQVTGAFQMAVDNFHDLQPGADPPRVDARIERAYASTDIADDHPVVVLACSAAASLSRPMRTKISGGGSDANVFYEHGIMVGVLGTGMRDVHTTGEHIELADMVKAAELVLEIIRLHSE
jgi:tripeptide aminopeptidase